MPSIVERIASGRALEIASRLASRTVPWRRGALVTLTYHRLLIAGNEDLHPGLATVDPDLFSLQMDELARDWNPVTLGDVLDAAAGGPSLPSRAVLVTFDDGYRDFGEVAWPIMAARGIRPTLFVVTGHATDPNRWFWWDRLHRALGRDSDTRLPRLSARVKALPHYEAMDLVNDVERESGLGPPRRRVTHDWSELRRLEAEGVDIAPHTFTHPLLHRCPPDLISGELRDSWTRISGELVRPRPAFAYPDGGFNPEVLELMGATEMEIAFTTARGGGRPGWGDPLLLPRVNVGARTDVALLRAQLAVFGGTPMRMRSEPGNRRPAYPRNCD